MLFLVNKVNLLSLLVVDEFINEISYLHRHASQHKPYPSQPTRTASARNAAPGACTAAASTCSQYSYTAARGR